MLTLPAKFQTELNKAVNTPSFLIRLEDGTLFNEQTLQADWAANSQNSQVDWLSQSGSVLVESTLKPENLTGDAWTMLSIKSAMGSVVTATAWQSFQQITGGAKTLLTIKGFFKKSGTAPALWCQLFAANKTTPIGVAVTGTVTSTAGEAITFDFTSQSLSISTATTYWIKFYTDTPASIGSLSMYYSSVSAYSGGYMTLNSTTTGDAYFQVTMGGFYKTTGYIRTQTMDLGSTPTDPGEWVLEDIKPTGTTLTYQAWASATGAFAGEETDLGAIVDGDAITNLKRYYRVKATLTANGDQSVSPTLQSIKADFTTYKTYSDNPSLGHETAILSVSSLSSSIDTFKPSTVGQITFSLNLSASVSNYLATKKPKNKLVQVKAGFVADGFTEADYIDYSWGQIDDWKITAKDEVTLTVKDFSKEWDVDVPKAETGQPLPEIVWGTSDINHPIDVMLDILKNHINARDSKILGSSFGTVKTALAGWIVSRTLKEDTVSAKDLMEELRLLTQTYFLPQADGKIKIKRWDAAEASIDTLTDADFKSKRWDSYAKGIINRYTHFYGWDGDGDEAADYDTVAIGIDTTSQTDWKETTSKEVKDKWTPKTQTTQVSDFLDKVMKRYANPPSMLYADVDLRKIALEVGDIVTVTTSRAPSTDMTGISNIKFQIINRNLDYSKHTMSLTMLECASSVNTQVEPPVAQPTIYDLPDHVEGLAIVEQEYTNRDGFYTPLIVVTYDIPTNSTYWSHALIDISTDSGSTYRSYGLDYNEGNGFIIDTSKVGGYVGGTFEVRVVSVNDAGITAPTATAPTASLTKLGGTTVLAEPPAAIRGLTIEGNPDPNNTQWDGLRFALIWWNSSQTGGAGVDGGLGAGGFVDPYWQGDEYELWVSGTCIDSGITKETRYDYVYGDGYLDYLDDKIADANGTVTFKVRRVSLNQASEWSTITITQAAPAIPTVTGKAFIKAGWFDWTKSEEADFSGYRIRTKISTGAWSSWSALTDNTFFRALTDAEVTLYGGNATIYIEVKAVDLYGNESGAGASNVTAAFVDVAIVADGSITAPKIAGGAVGTTQLADAAITTAKIANTAVDNSKLAALAVDAAKLADSAVTATKIANLAVGSAAIANLAVGTAHIADAAITNAKIEKWILGKSGTAFPGAPTDGESFYRTDLNITYRYSLSTTSWIAVDYIADAGRIVDGVITSVKIADAAISNAKIAALAVATGNIQDAAINTAKIGDAQITVAKIVDATITGAKIASATITTSLIADAQITGAKISSATITDANISSLNADKIVAGSIRGIGVYGSTHATKGSYLTVSCSAGATSLALKDTSDFPSSGSGWIIDSANDRDAFTWTSKDSTYLYGVSGVLAHTVSASNVPVVVPAIKGMVMADVVNEMRFFGNRGDGTIEELAAIGIQASGATYAIGWFGSIASTRVGIKGVAKDNLAIDLWSKNYTTAYVSNYSPDITRSGSSMATCILIDILSNQDKVSHFQIGGVRSASGAPSTGDWLVGEIVFDSTYKAWICYSAGTPGSWKALGT